MSDTHCTSSTSRVTIIGLQNRDVLRDQRIFRCVVRSTRCGVLRTRDQLRPPNGTMHVVLHENANIHLAQSRGARREAAALGGAGVIRHVIEGS